MAHCEIPVSGPSGISATIIVPNAGPSNLTAAQQPPTNGPSSLTLAVIPPSVGPTGLNTASEPPASGPQSLVASLAPPVAGPSVIFPLSKPESGPSGLAASVVPPVEGPIFLVASNTILGRDAPAAGPSGLSLTMLPDAPVAGPSGLTFEQISSILTDEEFVDPGVNVSPGLTVFRTGEVDNKRPGIYTLTYSVRDPATGVVASIERKVEVIQRPPPVIELDGSHTYYVLKGSAPFVPPTGTNPEGFTVFTVNNVDTLRNGSYQIIYYVQDEYKNTGMETVTVHVVDQIPSPGEGPGAGPDGTGVTVGGPASLTVTGGDQVLELGDTWFDPGVTTNEPGVTITVTYEKED